MIRISEKSVFSSLIFIFACVILYMTRELRGDVALVPKMVSVLLLIFGGIQMLMDLFPPVQRALSFLDPKGTTAGGEGAVETEEEAHATLWSRVLFFGWVAVYIVLISVTSMIWATVISLFVYLKWVNKESWLLSTVYTLATAAFIYVVFVIGFKLTYFL
jgi:hypothetical protein